MKIIILIINFNHIKFGIKFNIHNCLIYKIHCSKSKRRSLIYKVFYFPSNLESKHTITHFFLYFFFINNKTQTLWTCLDDGGSEKRMK